MLPMANRLRTAGEFAVTVRQGRRAGSPELVLHLAIAADRRTPRVGVVVNRRVGPAVVRNRVRRRLRHLAADRLTLLPPGALLVIRATASSAAASAAQLARSLDAALIRLLTVTT